MEVKYGSVVLFALEPHDVVVQEIIDWLEERGVRLHITIGLSRELDRWVATVKLPVGCEAEASILSFWPGCISVERLD